MHDYIDGSLAISHGLRELLCFEAPAGAEKEKLKAASERPAYLWVRCWQHACCPVLITRELSVLLKL